MLLASVFLLSGAMKLQEFAASMSAGGGVGSGGGDDAHHADGAVAPPPILAYASRRLDLVLASLGAPASVLSGLAPHLAALVALVGLGEAAGAVGLACGRRWGARALLATLALVTPVAHCFWLLPQPAAGLELGHAAKNVALAGALLLEATSGGRRADGGEGGGGGGGGGAERKDD